MKKLLASLVLLPLTVFSVIVIVEHGYFGFVTLSLREPWALQMLLDLAVALFFVGGWMRRDARAHGIPVMPYLLLLPFVGSISALGYIVHRSLAASRETTRGSTRSTVTPA